MLRLSRLLDFTTLVHEKLPRELRDMVYDHLYDVMDPFDFLSITSTVAYNDKDCVRPGDGVKVKEYWPCLITPGMVHPHFAKEMVETFYEHYEGFAVLDATNIGAMLETDFFETGGRISDHMLPALSVCIHLGGDYKFFVNFRDSHSILPACVDPRKSHYIDPSDVAGCFAPLLRNGQRLAPGFNLAIVLHTEWVPDRWRLRGGTAERKVMEEVIETFRSVLQACKPVISGLEEKCHAQIRIGLNLGGDSEMVVHEGQMDLSVDEWVRILEQLR